MPQTRRGMLYVRTLDSFNPATTGEPNHPCSKRASLSFDAGQIYTRHADTDLKRSQCFSATSDWLFFIVWLRLP
ncbi:hypothetical protein BCR43DRAFT_485800 [Syncephalastrum racemosum]|uniref:Uncharacterized protein n=1 Tax=Syncephalastrum racemosum TaxID=13706 RepID=A0A1X2HMZ1_SYNRA|nr:hypothetical protein BCR43DRAFT_498860 [Syncephalastrum racemosum]ORZ00773.1 hypothetical protein BCR43DRAFT_485762 [Syncephalastrum racemosum]ORZ00776.1 hypothetical protein BCR43DRAFT_485765 [Syncephalastrum racemosum]ORZ00791.1 hypothetical protein BCR43DRAFT_485789 [Syncephalastrum racemosum]ORZ00794.1 hypothetical protein BCR43DRAFT_485800 [Syncephalastrum racemosum]